MMLDPPRNSILFFWLKLKVKLKAKLSFRKYKNDIVKYYLIIK